METQEIYLETDGPINHLRAEYVRFRRLMLKRKVLNTCIPCGSFFELPFEYVLANLTDIDALLWIKTASPADHSNESAKRHKTESLIVDPKDCHAGFARLRKLDRPTLQESEQSSYYSKPSERFNKQVGRYTIGPSWPKILRTGPLFNLVRKLFPDSDHRRFEMQTLKEDFVYSVYCPSFPTEAADWITRERKNGWPPKGVIDQVVGFGCHFVPKPHQSNPDDDTQWRFSFSHAEVILIQSWTDVQKYIYHMLRLIKSEVVRSCGGEESTVLCAYSFKTLMLWACEEKPPEFWTDENLETSVGELLCQMIEWLIERCCPNYFIPTNNMIDYLPQDIDLSREILSLLHYREFGLSTLLNTEPKAYLRGPISFTVPQKLVACVLLDFNNGYFVVDSRWESLRKSLIVSNNFLPELHYLFKGIQGHLHLKNQLSMGYKDISSARKCFDLATNVRNEDVLPQQVFPHSSLLELLFDQFISLAQNLGLSLYSYRTRSLKSALTGDEGKSNRKGLSESRDVWRANDLSDLLSNPSLSRVQSGRQLICCYSRECNGRLCVKESTRADERHNGMFSNYKQSMLENGISQLLEHIGQSVISPSYLISCAYFANFYYTALSDYSSAAEQCEKVFQYLQSIESKPFPTPVDDVAKILHVVLINEWSVLFDKYLQIVLGFFTLCTAISSRPKPSGNQRRMTIVYLNPVEFLKYIHFQCVRKLNRGQIVVFSCIFDHVRKHMFYSHFNCKNASQVLLLTAIRISGIVPTRDGNISCVQWPV